MSLEISNLENHQGTSTLMLPLLEKSALLKSKRLFLLVKWTQITSISNLASLIELSKSKTRPRGSSLEQLASQVKNLKFQEKEMPRSKGKGL
jgi:hypothetical protein